jgi:predicted nucleotidyltransferase
VSKIQWAERDDPTHKFNASKLLREVVGDLFGEVEFGAVMEGSVPEGFGNRTSDVDFLIVVPDTYSSSEVPVISFVGGYRVEVRRRRVSDLLKDAEVVNSLNLDDRPKLSTLSSEKLDTYQRFMDGEVVLRSPILETALRPYSRTRFAEVVKAWHVAKMRTALRRATALNMLGDAAAARGWIRAAAISAGKSWVASRDELYLSDKWLGEQQARADMPSDVRAAFWLFVESDVYTSRFSGALKDGVEWIGRLGCSLDEADYACPLFGQSSKITTWAVGRTTLVLKGRTDLTMLSDQCATTWRRIAYGRPIADFFKKRPNEPLVRESLAALSRAGLLTITWDDGEVWERNGAPPLAVLASPPLSQNGLREVAGKCPPVGLLAAGSVRVIFAGCELVWANVCVENGWEDFHGAQEAGQWQAVASAARRTLAWACQVAFSAAAINPPPDRQEIVSRLTDLPEFPNELAARAMELQAIRISSLDEAEKCLSQLQKFVKELRSLYLVESFPESFEGADKWKATLEVILDWARVASYLDDPLSPSNRTFPIGEVRDMLGVASR